MFHPPLITTIVISCYITIHKLPQYTIVIKKKKKT